MTMQFNLNKKFINLVILTFLTVLPIFIMKANSSSERVLRNFLITNANMGSIVRNAINPYGNRTSLGSDVARAIQANAFSLMDNITSSGLGNVSALVSAAGLNPATLGMRNTNLVNNSIIGLTNTNSDIQNGNRLSANILSAAGLTPNFNTFGNTYSYGYYPYYYGYNSYYYWRSF